MREEVETESKGTIPKEINAQKSRSTGAINIGTEIEVFMHRNRGVRPAFITVRLHFICTEIEVEYGLFVAVRLHLLQHGFQGIFQHKNRGD